MLCHNCRITTAIRGLDPEILDRDISKEEKKWFELRPALKEMSEEEKEIRRQRIAKSFGRGVEKNGLEDSK